MLRMTLRIEDSEYVFPKDFGDKVLPESRLEQRLGETRKSTRVTELTGGSDESVPVTSQGGSILATNINYVSQMIDYMAYFVTTHVHRVKHHADHASGIRHRP